jgi:3-methyladenine DNA glycosylase/8-oxoguanine DNA glycosylase
LSAASTGPRGESAAAVGSPGEGFVLVREVVVPRWPAFRLGPPSQEGLTRRRGAGLVRLVHVDGEPVVVAVSGTVFAARAATAPLARAGIARMRHATGIDDDIAEFHARFGDDPVIGPAVRARPWLRVRRNPDPWETLAWAITEQLIELTRAVEIQKRMIYAFGRRFGAYRDAPDAATIAAASPAELEACGLHAKRCLALGRAAREVASGRLDWAAPERRLLAIREIGTWTVEMVLLHGLGRNDVVPAGDLGYLKLVGRLTTGNPRAVADEDEVRGFFERYDGWAGLAGQYLHFTRGMTIRAPRRAGTRWSAAAPRKAAA